MAQINIESGEQSEAYPLLNIQRLPDKLAEEGALNLELYQGVPVIKTSLRVQNRIESLVDKHKESGLSQTETEELDRYEEIDDFLSFLNRVIRNLYSGKTL